MINFANVINSQSFSQPFTILRQSGSFGAGGWIVGTPAEVSASGVIYPSTAIEINQVPEGDRVSGMTTFLSSTPFTLSHNAGTPGTSDRIVWHGDTYKIIQILDFTDYGFNAAVGVRIAGG